MSINEPQEPWASAMIAVGATDPRRDSVASWNRLGELAGVHTSTITGFISGTRTPSAATVQKIARALHLPPETVSGWIDGDRIVSDRYIPPVEASLLNDRQRKAVNELIRSIVTDTSRAGEEHEQRSAPTKPAGRAPAKDDYGLAARGGVSAYPDTSTLEEGSQDHGDPYHSA